MEFASFYVLRIGWADDGPMKLYCDNKVGRPAWQNKTQWDWSTVYQGKTKQWLDMHFMKLKNQLVDILNNSVTNKVYYPIVCKLACKISMHQLEECVKIW